MLRVATTTLVMLVMSTLCVVLLPETRHSVLNIIMDEKSKIYHDDIGWIDCMLRGTQDQR
jgi:hypothetical protein